MRWFGLNFVTQRHWMLYESKWKETPFSSSKSGCTKRKPWDADQLSSILNSSPGVLEQYT